MTKRLAYRGSCRTARLLRCDDPWLAKHDPAVAGECWA